MTSVGDDRDCLVVRGNMGCVVVEGVGVWSLWVVMLSLVEGRVVS